MVSDQHNVGTPIRIRGKRKARPEEKWNYGKRRDPKLQQRRPNTTRYGRQSTPTTTSVETSSFLTSRPRKRQRRHTPESPLEALPPEVLQTIFAYSCNIMLPLTSTQLASKLCNSMHLRFTLSDRLLDPVLQHDRASSRTLQIDLMSATRLLNSKFMDFTFFKSWLRRRSLDEVLITDVPGTSSSDVDWKALWSACQPSPGLLPPQKLFSAPFSDDKTAFLSILAQTVDDITSLNPSYGELAHEALTAAVQSGLVELASVLLDMGVPATTELLRSAVMDAACDEGLVRMLLDSASRSHQAAHFSHSVANGIDRLDPTIWSWAEKARENDNPKGDWLMGLLRQSQE